MRFLIFQTVFLLALSPVIGLPQSKTVEVPVQGTATVPVYDDGWILDEVAALLQEIAQLREQVAVLRSDVVQLQRLVLPNTPPVVTLRGDSHVTILHNLHWGDPLAVAVDKEDGELPVDVSGSVIISTPGQYTLTYSATDSDGATSSVERLVTVLAPDPETDVEQLLARPTVTPADFKLLGGWRIPNEGASPDSAGMGYTMHGNIHVEHRGVDERIITTVGKDPGTQGHRFSVSLIRAGEPGTPRIGWPQALPYQYLPQIGDPETATSRGFDFSGQQVHAIARPNGGMFLTSGRVGYAVSQEMQVGPYLSWVHPDTGRPVGACEVPAVINNRPRYGGGICDIPQWFADEFLGGRNLGIGCGGYKSGQGSSQGPTLAAVRRPADGDHILDATPLIWYKWSPGLTEQEKRDSSVQRPPDDAPVSPWGAAPYQGKHWVWCDQIMGGPFWVDTPTRQGLCYFYLQGVGETNYVTQVECFTKDRRIRLYTYSPSEILRVVRGEIEPWQATPEYHDWKVPWIKLENNVGSHWPVGAYFDGIDDYLYVSYKSASGEQYDPAPVVCVYTMPGSEAR